VKILFQEEGAYLLRIINVKIPIPTQIQSVLNKEKLTGNITLIR